MTSLPEFQPPLVRAFPDPAVAFCGKHADVSDSFASADVVLDTNALLLPYKAGKTSLDAISKLYERLRGEDRLVIPVHVAREYLKNRPMLIAELLKRLEDELSRVNAPPALSFAILESLAEYELLQEKHANADEATKEYRSQLKSTLEVVRKWGRDDPVRLAYAATIGAAALYDPKVDFAVARQEFEQRAAEKIPPGYKDTAKDDGGLGDYLIWKSILHRANAVKRDVIFVSGEEKADWVHRANSTPFMPRVELLEEFRLASDGRQFFLVQLSDLLALMGASAVAVEELQKGERIVGRIESIECPHCRASVTWRISAKVPASAKPRCSHCGQTFHAHRTGNGIVIRRPHIRSTGKDEMMTWFFENFEDPANGVPYDGSEGGYQYFNGGPDEPLDVLSSQFSDEYPSDLIVETAYDIAAQHGDEWVRKGLY